MSLFLFSEYIVQILTYANHAMNNVDLRVTDLEPIIAPLANSSKIATSAFPNVPKTSTRNMVFANFVITTALMAVQVPNNLLAMEVVILVS